MNLTRLSAWALTSIRGWAGGAPASCAAVRAAADAAVAPPRPLRAVGMVQRLEGRILKAADFYRFQDDAVVVDTLDYAADVVEARLGSGGTTLEVSVRHTGGLAETFFAPLDRTKRLLVNTRGGDDQLRVDPAVRVNVSANLGTGNNVYVGGSGDDTAWMTEGNTDFKGGGGFDKADYSGGNAGVRVTLDGVANDGLAGAKDNVRPDVEYVVGTAYNDYLSAQNLTKGVLFNGGGGNDTLIGSGGPDVLDGGTGNDAEQGGAGGDVITGGTGNDVVAGGNGDDQIDLGDGDDDANGGAGNDVIDGGLGGDDAAGSTGNDTILGGGGDDELSGNDGADFIDGQAGDDAAAGGGGADAIAGGDGADDLDGGDGNDLVDGGMGDDDLAGDGGDDVLDGGGGSDELGGGAGGDELITDEGPGDGSELSDAADGGLGDDDYNYDDRDDITDTGPDSRPTDDDQVAMPAAPHARLTFVDNVRDGANDDPARFVRGDRFSVVAELKTLDGKPLAGKTVKLLTSDDRAPGRWTSIGSVVTRSDGSASFTWAVPTSPSADNVMVRFSWAGDSTAASILVDRRLPIG